MNRGPVERATLATLAAGIATLALSDFVRPVIWLAALVSLTFRFFFPRLGALSERAASALGWLALLFACAEVATGTAWIEALTDFLLLLAVVVVWEEPCPRNDLHRLIVAGFLVLASTVLTDSVLLAVPLAAWAALTLLAAMRIHAQSLAAAPPRLSARALFAIALAALALFILAPRTGTNPWLSPRSPRMVVTGFADVVRLGSFARSESERVVARIEALGLSAAEAKRLLTHRYWRGAVLSVFTGHEWRRVEETRIAGPARTLALAHSPVRAWLALYREPVSHAFLLVPEGTVQVQARKLVLSANDAGELRFVRTPSARMRVLIGIGRATPPLRPPVAAERAQAHISPAVRRFAARFAHLAPEKALTAMEAEMRTWRYALDAQPDPQDPIGWFLQHRYGHCELYASAFALAARALGLPSRVVTGYFGGAWNEFGRYLALRARDAHAWVEVWLAGRWQRFDPTPPVRWQQAPARGLAPARKLKEAWDAVKLAWYRYVLSFDARTRAQLAAALLGLFPWLFGGAAALGLYVLARQDLRGWVLRRWLAHYAPERAPGAPLRTLAVFADEEGMRFVRRWEAARYGMAPPVPWGMFLRALWRLSRRKDLQGVATARRAGHRRARAHTRREET